MNREAGGAASLSGCSMINQSTDLQEAKLATSTLLVRSKRRFQKISLLATLSTELRIFTKQQYYPIRIKTSIKRTLSLSVLSIINQTTDLQEAELATTILLGRSKRRFQKISLSLRDDRLNHASSLSKNTR